MLILLKSMSVTFPDKEMAGIMSVDRAVVAFSQAEHCTHLGPGFWLKPYLLVRYQKVILRDWAWAIWDGTWDYRQSFSTDAGSATKFLQCDLATILFLKLFLTPIYGVFRRKELNVIKDTECWQ